MPNAHAALDYACSVAAAFAHEGAWHMIQPRPRAKKWLFALISAVLPAAVILLGLEIFLRATEPPPLRDEGRVVRPSSNTAKRYELVPGAHGVVSSAAVSINSFGCRDKEVSVEKRPERIRIVAVGDSLTFGQGVSREQTWLVRLQDKLQTRGQNVEVINCGVFGYNVDEEAVRFTEVAELLRPDIMIVGYELGDVLRNPPPRSEALTDQKSEARQGKSFQPFSTSLYDTLKRSRVATFLAYRFSFLLKQLSLRNWDLLYADGDPHWENLKAKYEDMGAVARTRGFDVLVVIIPELSNLNERYPYKKLHDQVAAMCQRQGMAAVDLLPSFLGEDGPSLWIHPQDRHPNARATEIIAEGVVDAVARAVEGRQFSHTGRQIGRE